MEELWLDTLEDELFKEAVKFESYQFPIEILMKILSYGRVGKVCTSWMIADIALSRKKLVEKLAKTLNSKEGTGHEGLLQMVAANIEQELFRYCHERITKGYQQKGRQLIFNLGDWRNTQLKQSVLDGQMDAYRLVRLNASGLANPIMVAERRAWHKKRKLEVIRDDAALDGFAETDMFTCSNCHGKRTTYRQWRRKRIVDRTRIIVICLQCPYRWEL